MKNDEHVVELNKRLRFNTITQKGDLKISKSDGIQVFYVQDNRWVPFPVGEEKALPLKYKSQLSLIPVSYGNHTLELKYDNKVQIIKVFTPKIELFVDANRDGVVDKRDFRSDKWQWGKFKMGAIIAPNNDRENPSQENEFEKLVLDKTLVNNLGKKDSRKIVLKIKEDIADKIRVYRVKGNKRTIILGKVSHRKKVEVSPALELKGEEFLMEALEFPDEHFDGIIEIKAGIVQNDLFLPMDRVIIRVSPWLMTPNTHPPKITFVCRITKQGFSNNKFVDELTKKVKSKGFDILEIPPQDSR